MLLLVMVAAVLCGYTSGLPMFQLALERRSALDHPAVWASHLLAKKELPSEDFLRRMFADKEKKAVDEENAERDSRVAADTESKLESRDYVHDILADAEIDLDYRVARDNLQDMDEEELHKLASRDYMDTLGLGGKRDWLKKRGAEDENKEKEVRDMDYGDKNRKTGWEKKEFVDSQIKNEKKAHNKNPKSKNAHDYRYQEKDVKSSAFEKKDSLENQINDDQKVHEVVDRDYLEGLGIGKRANGLARAGRDYLGEDSEGSDYLM